MDENKTTESEQYTKILKDFAERISPEEETYGEDLLKVASYFKTFDAALSSFIQEQGYTGALNDVDEKVNFIKSKFRAAQIQIPRNVREWFTNHKRIERKTAFQICFAFTLNDKQTDDFFRRVYFERSFDCHSVEEAVYYFCMRNGFSYSEAIKIYAAVPKVKHDKIPVGTDVLYTGTIIEHINDLNDKESLISYLTEHIEQFGYNNATATDFIKKIWNQIAKDGGLAFNEGLVIGKYDTTDSYITTQHNDSEWNVLSQILGLDNYWHDRFSINRSIKPILINNALIPPIAEASFPDRDAINKVINNAHISNERIRKLLILLVFYSFWARLVIENQDMQFIASDRDSEKCVFMINKYLLDAGYPELYVGNPYDWVFLWAANDEYPLMTFRDYMREIFAVKSESHETF